MYEINDKVALITGGAAGIGAGVVRLLLEEGAKHVAVLDVDTENGLSLEKELREKHGSNRVKFYKCDVSSPELGAAFEDVVKNFNYIDLVVNNAGIMNDSPDVYEKEIAINVAALVTSTLKAYNLMRKDRGGKGGTVINISSMVALYQPALLSVYTATKSAVLQFSNCIGSEPNYVISGVRVIAICFGCTETALFSEDKLGLLDEESVSRFKTGIQRLTFQSIESAVNGLVHAVKHGKSGSTWLVTKGEPAVDITGNIKEAYSIMSRGIF